VSESLSGIRLDRIEYEGKKRERKARVCVVGFDLGGKGKVKAVTKWRRAREEEETKKYD